MALRIVSISCTFPNSTQPQLGIFVQARLDHLGALAEVKVIAPAPVLEYGNSARSGRKANAHASQPPCKLEVIRPRWLYPPMGGCLNALALAAQLLRPMAKLRRTFPFQLIDAHFGHPDGIAAALLAIAFRCPFTITLRGNETFHSKYLFRGLAFRWAVRRAPRVIAVSERLRQFAIECGAAPRNVQTIPNGVDTSVFHPVARHETRHELGALPDVPLLLSAGYLIQRKGHHRVIQAIHTLRNSGILVHLLIAGGPGAEGAYESILRKLVADLHLENQVSFLGQVPPARMAAMMSAADVFCLASTREGWPNVVNEALACGTPVVATDIGGVPDMLPSERYGIIVPVDDQDCLTAALARAVQKQWDRDTIAEWGMRRSWAAVAADVHEVMLAVAQPGKVVQPKNDLKGSPECESL